jgi:hypothetical protein
VTASNFGTHNDTFRKLMGNGLTYVVPRFQRNYSWDVEQWEELWADLKADVPAGEESAHYMGYLVLRETSNKSYEIVDGQQRLATLSIVVLAALKNLQRLAEASGQAQSDQIQQRLRRIQETYIGAQDPVTLTVQPKLTLNRNNGDYFRNHLAALGPLPKRGVSASNILLRKAFEWFNTRLSTVAKESKTPDLELARFIEEMADRLFFTVITVTDELNAYRVFETLNARRLKLSPTDLLKNYLFATLSSTPAAAPVDVLESRWEGLVQRLGDDDFSKYVRAHWNSRHSFVRQAELFRRVRNEVRDPKAVFELIRELEEDLETYLDFVQPDTAEGLSEFKKHARILKLSSIQQPIPLLLACRRVLAPADFETVLRAVVVLSFRYNVICGLSPGDQENVYAVVARAVAAGQSTKPADVIARLKPIYPSDSQFRESFIEKSLSSGQGRNSRIVKYILCELEARLTKKPLDWANQDISVEHVLPQADEADWPGFSDLEAESYVSRIGNLTLLSASRNAKLGHASWPTKKAEYAQSEYLLTREIAQDDAVWSPERVHARQRRLADAAVAHWRLTQFD